jgi:gas vesicle protein
MAHSDDKNALLYLLAGFGLGALIGALAGVLFAPKSGKETKEELLTRLQELKQKSEEMIAERRAKKTTEALEASQDGV